MVNINAVDCRPSDWLDVLIFFASNYAVHVATVPVPPGSTFMMEVEMKLWTLISPYYGVGVAATLITKGALWTKSPLQKAARSGALCVVTRTESWTEEVESVAEPVASAPISKREEAIRRVVRILDGQDERAWYGDALLNKGNRKIHGQIILPEGYGIVRLHRFEEVKEFSHDADPQFRPELDLPCNYSALRVLAGITQIIFGTVTLYLSSQGEQLSKLGPGTFSLTVIPYVLMSLMNCLAALSCPEYPSMFMIESKVMDEARERGGFFVGTVGRVNGLEANGMSDPDSSQIYGRHPNTGIWSNYNYLATQIGNILRLDDRLHHNRARIGSEGADENAPTGRYAEHTSTRQLSASELLSWAIAFILTLGVISAPFIIMGVLNVLKTRESRDLPAYIRAFQPVHLVWLSLSILQGLLIGTRADRFLMHFLLWVLSRFTHRVLNRSHVWGNLRDAIDSCLFYLRIMIFMLSAAFSIWIFYLVGRSIMEFETCSFR